MAIRGIRGAVTVNEDKPDEIEAAVLELVKKLHEVNPTLLPADIASVIFTVSPDIHSDYPAHGVRKNGWSQVPLLCSQEIPVPGGLPRCIRLLLHWNTDLPQSEIRHVYLGEAAVLRPDL